jgi:hypothetical protein
MAEISLVNQLSPSRKMWRLWLLNCHTWVYAKKTSTHLMHDRGSIVPHIQPKVFIDNQMSRIKYNYYINNVSKDYDDSQRNRTAEDSITPHEWQPGQHVAYNSSPKNSSPTSPSKQQVWVAGENSKVEYTYGWYSPSAENRWYVKVMTR